MKNRMFVALLLAGVLALPALAQAVRRARYPPRALPRVPSARRGEGAREGPPSAREDARAGARLELGDELGPAPNESDQSR